MGESESLSAWLFELNLLYMYELQGKCVHHSVLYSTSKGRCRIYWDDEWGQDIFRIRISNLITHREGSMQYVCTEFSFGIWLPRMFFFYLVIASSSLSDKGKTEMTQNFLTTYFALFLNFLHVLSPAHPYLYYYVEVA